MHIKTEELFIFYFSGELKSKIKRYEEKTHQKWPDSYYNTMDSIQYHHTKTDTNNIADPTGERATDLARLSYDKKELYNIYLAADKAIKSVLEELTAEEIKKLKKYLDHKGKYKYLRRKARKIFTKTQQKIYYKKN